MTVPSTAPVPSTPAHHSPKPATRAGSTGHRLRQQWLNTVDQPWAVEALAQLPVRPGTLPHQLPAAIRADQMVAHACICAAQGEGDGKDGGRLAELAGQALLQVVFPMLVRMAGRDPYASLDDYLAEVWIRIQTLTPGPSTTVPTSLGLDALHAVCQPRRRLQRRESPQEISETEIQESGIPQGSRAVELFSAALALGILARSQLPVLASVYLLGLSSADAAAKNQISAAAVRARCSRATRTMRRHAEQLRGYLE